MLYSILFLSAVLGYLVLSSDSNLQDSLSFLRLFVGIVTSLLTLFTSLPLVQITINHFNQTNTFLPKEKEEEKPCEQEKRQLPESPQSKPSKKYRHWRPR